MKVFSKEKYIKVEGYEDYKKHHGWVDECDGKPVRGERCGVYTVMNEWCIDVPDAVNCKCVVKTREGQKGEKKMYTMKDFTDKKIAIRIPDRATADKVMKVLHDKGFKWNGNTPIPHIAPTVGDNRCIEYGWYDNDMIAQGKCNNTAKHGYKIVNLDEVQLTFAPCYKITIECDGTTTTARMEINGKEVKTAQAKRNPADKFDWRIGAETAFGRLFGKKEEKKPGVFKVGDRVVCVETTDGNEDVKGKHGKVVEGAFSSKTSIAVEFDKKIERGHSFCGMGKDGHCWYCKPETLRHE